jgi:hypothetical protein
MAEVLTRTSKGGALTSLARPIQAAFNPSVLLHRDIYRPYICNASCAPIIGAF